MCYNIIKLRETKQTVSEGEKVMKYFKNIKTLEELRKEYKRLVKENHPDNGGSVEAIKTINVEYEQLFKVLKNR